MGVAANGFGSGPGARSGQRFGQWFGAWPRGGRTLECLYVGAAGVLAALGGVRADGHYYLAAIVLTLPAGIAAFVSVYLGYALIEGVGGLFAATTTAGGDDTAWLTAASGTFDVLAFMAAAVVNVVLLEYVRHRRRAAGRRPDDGPVG